MLLGIGRNRSSLPTSLVPGGARASTDATNARRHTSSGSNELGTGKVTVKLQMKIWPKKKKISLTNPFQEN